jgi:hypothetical protein
MIKLKTSTSFRAVAKVGLILNIYVNLSLRQPTHSTILTWVKKIGLYQLKKSKDKSDDWVLIIDESIQIGQEKLLVIMGVQLSKVDFTKPLQFADLMPLCSKASSKWHAEDISLVIDDLMKDLGQVAYLLSDCGNNLKKTSVLQKIEHIPDISHWFASILKSIYAGNKEFQEFTTKTAQMRARLCCTSIAHIIPPKQRIHSRFMNVKTLSDWAMNALKIANQMTGELSQDQQRINEELSWIEAKRDLIHEIDAIMKVNNKIMKVMKHNGLTHLTIKSCLEMLDGFISGNFVIYAQKVKEYFNMLIDRVNKQALIITSDIIESAFGKYKNYLSDNKMIGITDLALCIPAFTFNLDRKDEIKNALETVSIKELKQWSELNIGKTLMKRRIETFKAIKRV